EPEINRQRLMQRLGNEEVRVRTGQQVQKVRSGGIETIDQAGRVTSTVAEHVVLALGVYPRRDLVEALVERGFEVYQIGDCHVAGRIAQAVRDGYRIGNLV
ncbi:MAG: hypothetical protein MUP04_10975, partial [Anaerolineae bacterium]|nr:hypothetical protein [Anaerolineae bacterium]